MIHCCEDAHYGNHVAVHCKHTTFTQDDAEVRMSVLQPSSFDAGMQNSTQATCVQITPASELGTAMQRCACTPQRQRDAGLLATAQQHSGMTDADQISGVMMSRWL